MIYLNIQMAPARHPTGSSSTQDPVLQLLQMMMAEREEGRTERPTNVAAMQQIAQMAITTKATETMITLDQS